MTIENITLLDILLTAFSGIGVYLITLFFKNNFSSNKKNIHNTVIQNNNKVKGDMAGGNIIKTKKDLSINSNSKNNHIEQINNEVEGDLTGGDIIIQ